MQTYLIALAIGPVQSLIDAARRTRDLWGGSWLLAEAAKAAALSLHRSQPGGLIFPCPLDPEFVLAPRNAPDEDIGNIANVVRAQVHYRAEQEVRELVQRALDAAKSRIAELCMSAKARVPALRFREPLWDAQISDILECYAAWVAVEDDDYRGAALRLSALLAARKATRDFVPAAEAPDGPGAGVRKSSLDGARESVLQLTNDDREAPRNKNSLRRLGLSAGEELDALAIAKRLAGNVEQFTAYSRIAADAWIQALSDDDRARLHTAYEPLVQAEVATKVTGNKGTYSSFPFDAQLLFGFRLENAISRVSDEERQQLLGLRKVTRELGEPVPYAVVLKADGDRMGELLGHATSAKQSREISVALQGFSDRVRGMVRAHRGHAIYAGGDDMLALLPLESAVPCAADLAAAFKDAMDPVAAGLGLPADQRPTLSVGLGIGHLMEPLGSLRARADAAERQAKDDPQRPRNALAIHLGIRSGATITWRCRWDEGIVAGSTGSGIQALRYFSETARSGQCPSRLGYEVRAIAQRLAWANGSEILPGIHAAELARTLADARLRGGDARIAVELRNAIEARARVVGLARLADELILGRWLAARTASDLGERE